MITSAPVMIELFDLMKRVARTDASILIRGETGTGKELVARALHALSRRKNGPFQAVNCATLTPELLASELFGHVRGAFTGAIRDRQGLFSLADGGTLFLDEVAELPLDLQARLLRVLQERSFVPVGGTEPVSVDVRLLAATHRSLRREVEARRFRSDLLYRIRVVPLYLPSLAEREGDIETLAWYFVDQLNGQGFRTIETFSPVARNALLAHDWPGNVRELRNVLEYAFAVGQGPVLKLDDLTPELRGEPPPSSPHETTTPTPATAERRRLLEALDACGGHRGKAAIHLGMSRTTLWRKLREHRLHSHDI
ncbi:MAG: sigma-54 dependent transcriptional regulator [Myxococcota bacterium]